MQQHMCGMQQMGDVRGSTVAERSESRRKSNRSGRRHRAGSRKLSSRLGKGKGLK